jgi:hypothetical protein
MDTIQAGGFAAMNYLSLSPYGSVKDLMSTQTLPADSPAAMAQVLAMVMASHSEIDPRELRLLEGLDAFTRIGMSEAAFLKIASRLRHGACKSLADHAWLHSDDFEAIDDILDGVRDTRHRLLLCRLASCVIAADGCIGDLERTLYDRMLLRWGYTRASVSQAILAQHVH